MTRVRCCRAGETESVRGSSTLRTQHCYPVCISTCPLWFAWGRGTRAGRHLLQQQPLTTAFYHSISFVTYDNTAIVNQSWSFSAQHLLNRKIQVSKAHETTPLEVNLSTSVDFRIITHTYTVLISDGKLAMIKPVEVMATSNH